MSNPITVAYSNFSRGIMDIDTNGRFDLPIYANGCKQCYNFYTNFKGNLIFRPGMKKIEKLTEQVTLKPFRFNQEQNYLMAFGNNTLYMYTFDSNNDFVRVQLKDGADLPVDFYDTPYSLEEARQTRHTQNFDLMYLAFNKYPPKELKRVAADKFEFIDHVITGNPFDDPTTGVTGYPSQAMFYSSRLWYAGTSIKPTNVWMSEFDIFSNFAIPDPIIDNSPFSFRLNDISNKIDWLYPAEGSLVAGAADGVSPINGGSYNIAITAGNVQGNRASVDGVNETFPITKDGSVFYISHNNRYVHAFNYDLLTEKFVAPDVNKTTYDITDSGIKKVVNKKDRNDLMYFLKNDGTLLTFNYNQAENITGWHLHETQGFISDIEVISDNFGKPVVFLVIERNGIQYLEKLTDLVQFCEKRSFQTDINPEMSDSDIDDIISSDDDAYNRCIANNLRECNFLDNSSVFSDFYKDLQIDYDENLMTLTAASTLFTIDDVGKYIEIYSEDGRTKGRFEIVSFIDDVSVNVEILLDPDVTSFTSFFKSISKVNVGSDYDGQSLSVVNDGGYLNDFIVGTSVEGQASGEIILGIQASVVVTGYPYTGIVETFPIGGQIESGDNSQRNSNTIAGLDVRCVNTAGGFLGTSFYNVEPVQKMEQGSLNYLPAALINGTVSIGYTDEASVDKSVFVKQDLPLPMIVTCLFVSVINGSDL